jgi:sugar-specific transcriptional regulator TrmB
MTLEEAWQLIDRINDDAHGYAYESWVAADEMDDDEEAENQRCIASEEQQEFFRDMYEDLDAKTKKAILAHRLSNSDFKEQFDTYYGEV